MKLNLKGKTVVVTGAAGGMGLATIKLLLDYNVKILALDIQKPTKYNSLNNYNNHWFNPLK